jgi:hypothetical protein
MRVATAVSFRLAFYVRVQDHAGEVRRPRGAGALYLEARV